MTRDEAAKLSRHQAAQRSLDELQRAFAARRCWCGKPAMVVAIGIDGIDGILPSTKDSGLCAAHWGRKRLAASGGGA